MEAERRVRRLRERRDRLVGGAGALVHAGAGAHAGDQHAPRPRRPCPSRWRDGRRTAAAASSSRRWPASGSAASAPPRRKRRNAGSGRKPATFAIRSRTVGRVNRLRSSPAASASRRQLWQCERWRASRRVSRAPRRVCAAVAMIPSIRRQRAPETMSSYSSVRRRRARNSVDSTAGRLMPMLVADLLVGEAFELAQDEDLVVRLREAAERAAQALDLLLGRDRRLGRRAGAHELGVIGGREPVVGVVGDLLGALGAAERVDAAVLGDLVEPGLERQRLLGLAHAAQRGDEDLLRHVLRAAMVLDHPDDVGVDAALVALVEDFERAIVAASHGGDQTLIGVRGLVRISIVCRRQRGAAHSPTHGYRSLSTLRLLPSTCPRALNPDVQTLSLWVAQNVRAQTHMTQITDIIRTLDELLQPTNFQDLGPNGLQVPGAGEVTRVVTAVSATARAERAGGRAGRAARARAPRAVLELPPDRAHAAAGGAPAAALQARHQPRRLPPAARRAPRGRQQRDPRARARAASTSRRSGPTTARRSGAADASRAKA